MSQLAPFAAGARVRAIAVDAAELTGVSLTRLLGTDRKQEVCRARFAAMWAARKSTGKSLPQIARALGDRDHTTVIKGLRRAEQIRATDRVFAALIDELIVRDEWRESEAA